MTICTGYHVPVSGHVGIVDNTAAMQEERGITYLAPVRQPQPVTLDQYAISGIAQFAFPFPLSEGAFLASHRPLSRESQWGHEFGLYFFLSDGSRELIYRDGAGVGRIVVLASREKPPVLASILDYTRDQGMFTIENVYYGESMKGLPEETVINRIRVVELEYRSVSIGAIWHRGAGSENIVHIGGNHPGTVYSNPVGVPNASWDVKKVLGEADVYGDGSAAFYVPARKPVFLQAIDSEGHVVQTMRSWATLQPGETFSCVGCHESKLEATPVFGLSEAMRRGPQQLKEFYGPARGFSFPAEIQPILDRNCISCHNASTPNSINLEGTPYQFDFSVDWNGYSSRTYSRSYMNLMQQEDYNGFGHLPDGGAVWHEEERRGKLIQWIGSESDPTLLPPYPPGSHNSPLIRMLKDGHQGVTLTNEEMDKINCWIDLYVPFAGSYSEGMNQADKDMTSQWDEVRRMWEARESQNINEYIAWKATGVKDDNNHMNRNVKPGMFRFVWSSGSFNLPAVDKSGSYRIFNTMGKPVAGPWSYTQLNLQGPVKLEPGMLILFLVLQRRKSHVIFKGIGESALVIEPQFISYIADG
jgi:hypothetical protein